MTKNNKVYQQYHKQVSVHVHSDLALHLYTVGILWSAALTVSFSLCSTFRSDSEQVTSSNIVPLFLFAWVITTWCSYGYYRQGNILKIQVKKFHVKHDRSWQATTDSYCTHFAAQRFGEDVLRRIIYGRLGKILFCLHVRPPESPNDPPLTENDVSFWNITGRFTSRQPTLASAFWKVLAPLCIGASKSLLCFETK